MVLELFNKIEITKSGKDAYRENIKRELLKEEGLAQHSKGLSTKAVDNPPIKCAEVKLLTKITMPSGKDAIIIYHADMRQHIVDT